MIRDLEMNQIGLQEGANGHRLLRENLAVERHGPVIVCWKQL